jgi:hypothetical protein
MPDARELGAAIVAAARANASSFHERSDGSVEFNAWWRGGEMRKVRVWPDRAVWADIKAHGMGEKAAGGGARDFAEVALGCTLRDMLDRFGRGDLADAREVPRGVRRQVTWAPGEAHQCWAAHLASTDLAALARVQAWLRTTRGIGQLPASGMVPVQPSLVPALEIPVTEPGRPATVQAWVKDQLVRGGPAVLLPLWSAAGTVDGLVMRFGAPRPGGKKSLNLLGLRQAKGRPAAFGLPHRLRNARAALVVEGAPDTWAAEWLMRPWSPDPRAEGRHGVAVFGVDGISKLREWVEPVARAGLDDVVVLPQLDDVSPDAMHAFGVEVAKLGTRVRLASWEVVLRVALGCGVDGRPEGLKDLADLTREAHARGVSVDVVREALLQGIAAAGGGQHAAA